VSSVGSFFSYVNDARSHEPEEQHTPSMHFISSRMYLRTIYLPF